MNASGGAAGLPRARDGAGDAAGAAAAYFHEAHGDRRAEVQRVRLRLLALLPLMTLCGGVASAAEYRVTAITEDDRGRFRFEPALLRIHSGDIVRFVLDSHLHGTKAVPGMLPEGALPWWSAMGTPLVLRLEVPGVYGYKCPSHYNMGMVGLIVVDDPSANLDQARRVRHPPAAQRVFDQLFAQLACELGHATDCSAPDQGGPTGAAAGGAGR